MILRKTPCVIEIGKNQQHNAGRHMQQAGSSARDGVTNANKKTKSSGKALVRHEIRRSMSSARVMEDSLQGFPKKPMKTVQCSWNC